ncbi:chromosome segregation protein SMC [Idiomarina xiamenensis]|uniref:Chromosome partition protein Smc n=1 Tax=Idiomarina xiamenensis 10-D-4 TaxID=740709 RepID=K2L2Y0_9GAMM|nr:chromosome segregation protein SMC [Idiomarina xiamenensis]EKE84260.1 chromosome segregation ATPase, sms [Idiomarina xiamenensis 10-D-4]
MRLKHIKLVGFKSFVDATKVAFPGQMTCVVGPNGCGKSNVIDAVRWVLGESSARNLRGDAMTDVIFNGSTARKPVSQASVELVFDNTSGRIQGEYANFNEISVKRLVSRDGQSSYFLNNSKCRRRDITDLFLGTGLGPRSYAIIEQGMISRLVESKPQELRVFIEEAAGISKYKERRRETENRMLHTRDNLERLTDVRDELGKQLDKLQRQAAAARRYKALKSDERRLKAELHAIRWLANEQLVEQLRLQQQQQQTALDALIAEQRSGERDTTSLRVQAGELSAQLDRVQQQYYECGTQSSRLEQQIQHQRQQRQQQSEQQRRLQQRIDALQQQLDDERQQCQQQQAAIQQSLPDLSQAEQQLEQLQLAQQDAADAYQQWQQQYQQQQQQQAQQQQQLQRIQLQAEHAEQARQRASQTAQQLQQQQQPLQQRIEQLQQQLQQQADQADQQQLAQQQSAVSECQQQLQQLQAQQQADEQQLRQQQGQQQQLLGQQQSLQRLLAERRREQDHSDFQQWLATQQEHCLGSVADLLQWQPGQQQHWQLALENLLRPWLNAQVMRRQPDTWPSVVGAKLVLLDAEAAAEEIADDIADDSVAALLQGPLRQWRWLQQVRCCQQAPSANDHNWLALNGDYFYQQGYVAAQVEQGSSELAYRQELTDVEHDLQQLSAALDSLAAQIKQRQTTLEQQQQQLVSEQQQLQALQQQQVAVAERERHQQQQLAELTQRLEQQQAQQQAATSEAEQQAEQALLLQAQYDELIASEIPQQQATQAAEGESLAQRLRQLTEQMQQRQQQLHQLQLQQQQQQADYQQAQKLHARSAELLQDSQRQLEQLSESPQQADSLAEQQMQLEQLLDDHQQLAEQKQQLTQQLAAINQEISEIEAGQQGIIQRIEKQRAQLESVKLELTAVQERSRSFVDAIEEMNQRLRPLLESLPDDHDEQRWQRQLDDIARAVQRLGAINLAAIEEADSQAERKGYLDQQHQDLSSALETLSAAIRKIDRETRQRFKETYEAINSDLQRLFPKVFGGGSASLALTDDDLLETGVAIMARPPGKKNSTIHLLSGGEKALTALSLVFAIFRLNPAPFCLLDEVDAPLDDANVGRFCRLVQEMSETVQFIYISHNKVAMEMSSHLAGVTMQEAGVSRLVAVDIEAAVAMTDS